MIIFLTRDDLSTGCRYQTHKEVDMNSFRNE